MGHRVYILFEGLISNRRKLKYAEVQISRAYVHLRGESINGQ